MTIGQMLYYVDRIEDGKAIYYPAWIVRDNGGGEVQAQVMYASDGYHDGRIDPLICIVQPAGQDEVGTLQFVD